MALTERAFYTILTIALLILAIIVPIIVVAPDDSRRPFQTWQPPHKFYNLSELEKELDKLVNWGKRWLSLEEFGKSHHDNKIHEVVVKVRNTNKPMVLVVCGILGKDWGSMTTCLDIMRRLIIDLIFTAKLLSYYELHFVPLFNPDGYEFSRKLPIFCNWYYTHTDDDYVAVGKDILFTYQDTDHLPKEAEAFKAYIEKYKDNIKAVFFLHSLPNNSTAFYFTITNQTLENFGTNRIVVEELAQSITRETDQHLFYYTEPLQKTNRIDEFTLEVLKDQNPLILTFIDEFHGWHPDLIHEKTLPCELDGPWILSRSDEEYQISIPADVTEHLQNYHIMGIEFLYHNYRRQVKGVVMNQDLGMNFPLQVSAFFRALIGGPALVLVICSRDSSPYWHFHLTNHANFNVITVTTKNAANTYEKDERKVALLLYEENLKQCEELSELNFSCVVIEDLDQIAIKRVIKRLSGSFNIGLTHCNFYINPDQKLQWNMLNWVNPGTFGKLKDFHEVDDINMENFQDNYHYWWQRLTWEFCESFKRPTSEELDSYEVVISNWAAEHSHVLLPKDKGKSRKRKKQVDEKKIPEDKYVKLPSMDQAPIVNSIIKNFEISPEPIFLSPEEVGECSRFEDENSVIISFLEDRDKPSTSRSESEDFIVNLI